ncbi:MAG TPA: GNAT family N-acetyltransferase [Pirellulales bacterium]|jgi:CelD/BcsL family acetyltransferase involved in cellulose biosynthesis|nr:GNAT family N-acetyltransferase [Pirellulales bacterium]
MISTPGLQIIRLSSAAQLAPWRNEWNALAGDVVFRTFDWLECWWRSYATSKDQQLLVLAVLDPQGRLAGVAPWYVDRASHDRSVIRFLGSGEVCSDYLTILCRPGFEDQVPQCLAYWLCETSADEGPDALSWEMLELRGVDAGDAIVTRLTEYLAAGGNLVYERNRASCWRVHLPDCWADYLAMLSKSHRKQIRRLERTYFASGRARLHTVEHGDELARGLELLTRLHQRRRESLGERGCFASPRFAAFHAETAERLLQSGKLRLTWLEVDGQPVAVEYQVLGGEIVYAYQSGIEPSALNHQPGKLITLATLQQALGEGRQAFDFLRGDELYKAHWRAQPRPTRDIHILRNRLSARLRHHLWLAGGNVKNWLKRSLHRTPAAPRSPG